MSGFCPKIRILVVTCCLSWDKSTDFGQENSTYFILFKMKNFRFWRENSNPSKSKILLMANFLEKHHHQKFMTASKEVSENDKS